MPRQRNNQAKIDDLLGQAVEIGVNTFVDRAYDVVENIRQRQLSPKQLPPEYLAQQFTCVGCRNKFGVDDLEMVHPNNGFATCKNCYKFMWDSAEQKLKWLASRAAQRGAGARPAAGAPAPETQRIKPWEVLGISRDATEEEIKKAYRKKALECHPDTVPESASFEEKQAARERFEVLTKAKNAMMGVRNAAEKP